jgi:DNA recombination protein RmuC
MMWRRGQDPAMGLLQQQVSALRETVAQSLESGQSRVNERLEALSRNVGERIEASRKTLDERLESTGKVVREVQRSLGEVDASVKGVSQITRDIRALQDILKAPKLRGGLGEFFLGDLLAQVFPPSQYTLQYGFASGERVDAVIRAGNGLVPVDAKFPLENFRRVVEAEGEEAQRKERRAFLTDIRKHVNDIATKYIRPDEGTYDFALMYIPAENVYYEAVVRDEEIADEKGVLSYALSKRVIPVSPNSFYAYLQVILIGLQGLRIESQARQILERIQGLRAEFSRLGDDFGVAGKHMSNALNRYAEAEKHLNRFAALLETLSEMSPGEAPAGEIASGSEAVSRTLPIKGA